MGIQIISGGWSPIDVSWKKSKERERERERESVCVCVLITQCSDEVRLIIDIQNLFSFFPSVYVFLCFSPTAPTLKKHTITCGHQEA